MRKNDCDLWSKQSKRKVIGIFLPFLQLCVSLNLYLLIFFDGKAMPLFIWLRGLKGLCGLFIYSRRARRAARRALQQPGRALPGKFGVQLSSPAPLMPPVPPGCAGFALHGRRLWPHWRSRRGRRRVPARRVFWTYTRNNTSKLLLWCVRGCPCTRACECVCVCRANYEEPDSLPAKIGGSFVSGLPVEAWYLIQPTIIPQVNTLQISIGADVN